MLSSSLCTPIDYNDITWVSWHLKSPAIWLFVQQSVQTNNKDNIKLPFYWSFACGIHWSLVDENPQITGGFVPQRASNVEIIPMSLRHHAMPLYSNSNSGSMKYLPTWMISVVLPRKSSMSSSLGRSWGAWGRHGWCWNKHREWVKTSGQYFPDNIFLIQIHLFEW